MEQELAKQIINLIGKSKVKFTSLDKWHEIVRLLQLIRDNGGRK